MANKPCKGPAKPVVQVLGTSQGSPIIGQNLEKRDSFSAAGRFFKGFVA